MYCNSCLKQIPKDEIVYCHECGVPMHESCANHCLECGQILCDSCYSENHFRCSDCFDASRPFKTIRRSYLKQYETCPHSLYLQLIENIEPPMSKYAQLGIIAHAIFEDMQHQRLSQEQARGRLITEVEDWNMNTEETYSIIDDKLLQQGLRCINNFTLLLPKLKGDFKTEKKIIYSIDKKLPDISCTLDRISFVNDEIHIHDWKTGKPLSGKALIEELQPPLYLYAIKKEYGKMPETFTLHYLDVMKNIKYRRIDDDNYEVKTSRKKYNLSISDSLNRTRKILDGINKQKFPIPEDNKIAWYCDKMCWYGMSGTCRKLEQEEWHNIAESRKGKI